MLKTGLTSKTVREKHQQWGFNEWTDTKQPRFGHQLLKMVKEPVILLLITCNLLYLIMGNRIEGSALTISLVLMIVISYYQFRKTQKTLTALKELQTPYVEVIRDGKAQRIPGRDLVPGDLLNIQEGTRIGADAKLVAATQLYTDESMITGESLPILKAIEDKLIGGTVVTSGKGQAIVTAIGNWSTLGKMEKTINPLVASSPASQKEMQQLIKVFFIIGLLYTLFLVIYLTCTRGHLINAVLTGLSTAIALIPEEFPVVFFLFTAFGAWRLAQIKIVAQRPETLETMGAITVIGMDKTGTLTQNKMAIVKIASPEGTRYSPTEDKPWEDDESCAILSLATQAAQEMKTDAIDRSLLQTYRKQINSPQFPPAIQEFTVEANFPATAQIRYNTENTHFQIALKGAPEWVIQHCTGSPEEKARWQLSLEGLVNEGYRVIAIAQIQSWTAPIPQHLSTLSFTFRGFIAFADPLRPEALQVVQMLHKAGIRPILLTGDHPITAQHIAQKLQWDSLEYIDGNQLEKMEDQALQRNVQHCSIFARIRFDQKIRIIEALKQNGDIVAMTGDGVNDAGALRAAQVGIAMGQKGTDVAREAAALIVLEDNLNALPKALLLGRRVMDNIKKAFGFIIAVHIPILTVTVIPIINTAVPLLLFPMHIVFLELIIDPICAIAFENEAEEKNSMTQPPHKRNARFLDQSLWISGIIKGSLMAVVMCILFTHYLYHGANEKTLRGLIFLCLISSGLVLTLNMISKTRSIGHFYKQPNKPLFAIVLITTTITGILFSQPFLQQIFQIEALSLSMTIYILGSYLSIFLLLEGSKIRISQ
ncbi:cation-translocating P-type ATPase [Flavobacterium sp. N1719]|uniref:cation-translocating P-type ATPase n=1 Tax=Flavobacterium sp. N1719 TaxID=2885633 RepID=UPI002221EEE3|nr:HAD-IC family P-type ATPase [Flavobacterium sp. N1719]